MGKRNGQRPISCQVAALSFEYVLLLNRIYVTAMCRSIIPLRFICKRYVKTQTVLTWCHQRSVSTDFMALYKYCYYY